MDGSTLFQGRPVTLPALLDSRETRAAREKSLLLTYGTPVLVILANMPGAVKDNPAARRIHAAAMEAVERMLQSEGIPLLHRECFPLPTGAEGYFCVDAPAEILKRHCCALEQAHPWGRLFDLDVIGLDGVPLSRRNFGFPARACLVCGGPAPDCVSRGHHSIEEVYGAILAILQTEV